MSEPNGYLIHGTAFSSKEAAFKALVSNHEQESWFHKIWDEDAQPYYFESQPRLTIPKIIADELDKVEMNWNTLKDEAQGWPTDDLIMWLDAGNNPLMFAYLAGKALGVDLVKVGEE